MSGYFRCCQLIVNSSVVSKSWELLMAFLQTPVCRLLLNYVFRSFGQTPKIQYLGHVRIGLFSAFVRNHRTVFQGGKYIFNFLYTKKSSCCHTSSRVGLLLPFAFPCWHMVPPIFIWCICLLWIAFGEVSVKFFAHFLLSCLFTSHWSGRGF